jgi:hypothetical protein
LPGEIEKHGVDGLSPFKIALLVIVILMIVGVRIETICADAGAGARRR